MNLRDYKAMFLDRGISLRFVRYEYKQPSDRSFEQRFYYLYEEKGFRITAHLVNPITAELDMLLEGRDNIKRWCSIKVEKDGKVVFDMDRENEQTVLLEPKSDLFWFDMSQKGWTLVSDVEFGEEPLLRFQRLPKHDDNFPVCDLTFSGNPAGQHHAEQLLVGGNVRFNGNRYYFPGTVWRDNGGVLKIPYLCKSYIEFTNVIIEYNSFNGIDLIVLVE